MKTTITENTILIRILKRLENITSLHRDWFTPEQVADYLGLSINTIYQYVSKKRIPYYKIPNSTKLLFKKAEIDEWIGGRNGETESIPKKIADEIWESVK